MALGLLQFRYKHFFYVVVFVWFGLCCLSNYIWSFFSRQGEYLLLFVWICSALPGGKKAITSNITKQSNSTLSFFTLQVLYQVPIFCSCLCRLCEDPMKESFRIECCSTQYSSVKKMHRWSGAKRLNCKYLHTYFLSLLQHCLFCNLHEKNAKESDFMGKKTVWFPIEKIPDVCSIFTSRFLKLLELVSFLFNPTMVHIRYFSSNTRCDYLYGNRYKFTEGE